MKIIIVADLYYPLINGCAVFARRLAQTLSARNHQVIVIAPSESYQYTQTQLDGINIYGVRSFPLTAFYPKFRIAFSWFYNKKLEKIIKNFTPDVIHCQFHLGVNRAVLKIAHQHQIPVIATNHFMPETMVHYVPFSSKLSPLLLRAAWKDFARVFRLAQTITTPTETAANLIKPFGINNVIPVSNGIDLERFKPNQPVKIVSELKSKLALPNKPILLYVGRLDKEKNLDWIIRATAFALKYTDFHCVIAGKGVLEKPLRQLTKDLAISHHVTFTGFISEEDLPALYCLSDCFIIAGTAELQSLVTMEAMASGLPIIALNAVALPELVHNGHNGFLFDPVLNNNIYNLAEKIKCIFQQSELRKNMGQKSLEIIQRHDIKKIIQQFEQIYSNAILPVRPKINNKNICPQNTF